MRWKRKLRQLFHHHQHVWTQVGKGAWGWLCDACGHLSRAYPPGDARNRGRRDV